MLRGLLTITVSSVLVVLLGLSMCAIGLVYPFAAVGRTCMSLWARAVLACAGVRLHIAGRQHVPAEGPRLFVGNHQSSLDIPILVTALCGRISFMAKDSLFRIPIFGWAIGRYGHIAVNRSSARQTVNNLKSALQKTMGKSHSLLVFPEATRSRDGRLLPFRRGAFKIGKWLGAPIIPFAIDGSLHVNEPNSIRARSGAVRLTFLPPIPAKDVVSLSTAELSDRVRSCIATALSRDSNTSFALMDQVEHGAPQSVAKGA